ncbi:hypothetical protein CERSUDRAFT_79618 [Gelatoporia subvermispora B]|uniref:DH domain-containing protein n=1 Tax=Ceriporiopsis subvermispora (strain B) TaxID=914234 RepID=M2PYP9_CERS8|nr:hypothetical protein CERSUDRAFT_79618 [Gelatoporia subvermispora B]
MASAYGRAAPDPNALSSRASLLPLSDQRHEPRKLKKKRPAPLESATVPNRLRKSKSMEKQRATSLGFLPPVRPEEPFRMSIPRQYQGSAESSPVLPHKNSSQALADLAWTGLSSSALARLTARLNVQAYSPERAAQMSEIDLQATLTAHPPGGPSRHERPSVSVEGSPASTLRPLVSSPLTGLRTPHAAMSSRSSIISGIYSEPDPHGSFPATRRWTLAMADVDDDVLVQELDRLRKEEAARARGRARRRSVVSNSHTGHNMREYHRSTLNWPESPRSSDGHWRDTHFGFGSESGSDDEADETIEEEDGEEDDSEDGPVNAADEAAWKSARRALLCCRELVRTERSYQTCLRQLLATQSGHPLAPLLNAYIPALISASEALLGRLVDDPSAWGVSAAFIGCEEELEAAFVAWGGVVGEFFTGQDGAREREKRGRKVVRKPTEETPKEDSMARSRSVVAPLRFRGRSKSTAGPEARGKDEHQPAEAQRSSMFELKGTGMFTAALGTGLPFGLAPAAQQQGGFGHHVTKSSTHVGGGKSPGGTLSRTLTAWKRKSMPSSLSSLPTLLAALSSSPPASPTEKEKMARDMHGWDRKLTVRDLAIQPTQRVMRYVLQYRDLLEHTPISSPSRGLVERALDSAVRIAQKCDRAQGNSAFLRRT